MNESFSCFKLHIDNGQGRSHAAVEHVCRLAETFSRMHKKQYLRDWGRGGVDATALLPNKRRWSSQREEKEGQMGDGRARAADKSRITPLEPIAVAAAVSVIDMC